MAEFFRFRSIDSLLGKHRELEEQTIYFASPDELNDPMEGLRDIVWDGDKIVWTNFFKHYVFCLNWCYFLLNVAQHSRRKLETADIPILERWDQITIPIEQNLFDDIWERFCNLPHIQEIIEVIANTGRKIRYREVVSHLLSIQVFGFLDEIRKSYIDHGLISGFPIPQLSEEPSQAGRMEILLNSIKQSEEYENEHALGAVYHSISERHDDIGLTVEYNTRTHPPEILEGINRSVMLDFPKVYVEQLDRLLWVKWYTACFTGSPHNSSVWAKYADSHKGVCLIFEDVEKDNLTSLKLNRKTTNSPITLPFHAANYRDKPGEIDFFRSICRTTVSTLMELWYTDQDGNVSECAAHIRSDDSQAAWQVDYRNNFLRDVTFKTRDWEYEQEYRLILEDTLSQYNEKNDRKLTYDFNSLKGIIFGIRTSREDKLKIIQIIEKKKKCAGNNQTDFTYFQAYYSANDSKIHKREIRLGYKVV